MSYDLYKAAVLRALPAAEDLPLEGPPAEGFDLQGQTCPHCGNHDAVVQQVEDAEVAKCPQCQCEFSPRLESVSRKVIRQISERRERRLRILAERLPIQPPVQVDRTDYALFRKLVDTLGKQKVPNQAWHDSLAQVRQRFMDERTAGWTHPGTGVRHAPIAREEAERRWAAGEPRWRNALMRSLDDPEMQRRLGVGWDEAWGWDEPAQQAAQA